MAIVEAAMEVLMNTVMVIVMAVVEVEVVVMSSRKCISSGI